MDAETGKPAETAAQRYSREAKARLASRVGDDLAEEFTSAAESSLWDVASVAELMAAAYKMGQGSREASPEDLPAQYALQFRIPGRDWVTSTSWLDERYMTISIEELLKRYQRNPESSSEEWRAVVARPQVVTDGSGSQARDQAKEAAGQPLAASEPEDGCQQAAAEATASEAQWHRHEDHGDRSKEMWL
jgi:hypothetical protein